ncbi:MAG: hypothetical protein M1825_005168 [Sarcosagium campestre]|nr:MAG: hypothetical protein M1825_005168 [Sarcosagium campestre]
MEEKHGWTITAARGSILTTRFRGEILLEFDMSSFLPNDKVSRPAQQENGHIALSYIGNDNTSEDSFSQGSVGRQFFADRITKRLLEIEQREWKVQDLLTFVSDCWTTASAVTKEEDHLNMHFPTGVVVSAGDALSIRSTMLLPNLATKVEVLFDVDCGFAKGENILLVKPTARVVYGERYNQPRMCEFLAASISASVSLEKVEGKMSWCEAVQDLEQRLIARGKKS